MRIKIDCGKKEFDLERYFVSIVNESLNKRNPSPEYSYFPMDTKYTYIKARGSYADFLNQHPSKPIEKNYLFSEFLAYGIRKQSFLEWDVRGLIGAYKLSEINKFILSKQEYSINRNRLVLDLYINQELLRENQIEIYLQEIQEINKQDTLQQNKILYFTKSIDKLLFEK